MADASDTAGPLVLVVEDEPDLLEVAQQILECEGMIVATARDGEQALRMLARVAPDVILTDMMMPNLDGLGLLRRLADAGGERPPVVAMSAFEPYLVEARKLGAAATLTKPFELTALVDTVRCAAAGDAPKAAAVARRTETEASRVRTIIDLGLDAPAPEPALKSQLDDVARYFGVPIVLASIVTDDRQYWTEWCGLPPDLAAARGTSRDESFCTHAVAARAALVVQDACQNPLFHDNPLVRERGIRFYAGVPLIARHGEAVGTLCLLDYQPRRFSHFDLEAHAVFARLVLATFESREKRQHPETRGSTFRYLHYIDEEYGVMGKVAFEDLAVVDANRAIEQRRSSTCVALAVPSRRLASTIADLRRRFPGVPIGRLGFARLGCIIAHVPPEDCRDAVLEIAGPHSFVEALALDRYVGAVPAALREIEGRLGDAGLI